MDYELAKMLRDAGFPQVWPKPDFLEIHDAVAVHKIYEKYPEQLDPYRPTLEELIEACGDIHFELYRTKPIPGYAFLGNYFISTNQNEVRLPDPRPVFHSETPDECFAYLWLAINKK